MTRAFLPLALVTVPIQNFQLFWVNLLFVALVPAAYAALIHWGSKEHGFTLRQVLILDGIGLAWVAVVLFGVLNVLSIPSGIIETEGITKKEEESGTERHGAGQTPARSEDCGGRAAARRAAGRIRGSRSSRRATDRRGEGFSRLADLRCPAACGRVHPPPPPDAHT
jgi:hypothetical protein